VAEPLPLRNVLAARARLGEGPSWDAEAGVLWWVDIHNHRVHRFDPAAGEDTVYEVGEGASFATSYKVVTLSVADGCGQLLYGDDRFRLCEGEELLK